MTINVNKVKIIVIIPIESVEEVRDQTCPIMIQRLNNIFQRNPLISIGI